MVNQSNTTSLLNSELLGKWISQRLEIWQLSFISASELGKLAEERGIKSISSGDYIKNLWQLGLIRADLIESSQKIDSDGMNFIEKDDNGVYYYTDSREVSQRQNGWGGAFSTVKSVSFDIKPFFHPFRFYVLYQLDRVLRLHVHPLQALSSTKKFPKSWEVQFQEFEQWSSTSEFSKLINHWNDVAVLAIATEPCMFSTVFGHFNYSLRSSQEEYFKITKEYWNILENEIKQIGLSKIEKIWNELCFNSQILDPNKKLHVLLRLTEGDARLKIKGGLGGAIYLLTMAEIIRRSAEKAFGVKLPEEDDAGAGPIAPKIKQNLYGSDRILDGDQKVKNQFLRSYRLDYGVRLRWYVEGDTEYHGLYSILGENTAIDFKNLKGEVTSKRGKGASFRDDLRGDLRTNTFTYISIDGDKSENVRVIQKAATDDELCGMFFISKPDFEFQNFTKQELIEIAWNIALENGALDNEKIKLIEAVSNCKSGKEFISSASKSISSLHQIGKGEIWGKRLIEFAWENQKIVIEEKKQTRQIIESVELAIKAINLDDYLATRNNFRVDPKTGKLIIRN